jgi:large repetitive protein
VSPAGWTVEPWVEGGTGTLEGGMLVLDGAKVGCEPLLLSPRSLEISAVFAARPDQLAGLGVDFVNEPWVMFSTKWGRRLYGRTHLLQIEDRKLSADWFGAPHVFRIDWNVLDIIFSVDGDRQAHLMIPVPGYMRALAANQRLGTEPLRIEWMRMSPYAPAGRFTSRVFDAGAPSTWGALTWEADIPERTSVALEVRTGGVARPGSTWTPWRRVRRSGDPVATTSRYLQYRALLATADPSWTPALRRVTVGYSAAAAGSSSSSLGATNVLGCQ